MVLDFQGFVFLDHVGYCSVLHPKPEVGLGNGTLPETGLRGRQCSLALSKKVLFEAFGKGWSISRTEMDRSMGCLFFWGGSGKFFFWNDNPTHVTGRPILPNTSWGLVFLGMVFGVQSCLLTFAVWKPRVGFLEGPNLDATWKLNSDHSILTMDTSLDQPIFFWI